MEPAKEFVPGMGNPKARKWKTIYPAYINSTKTLDEGRRIPKSKALENPTILEIGEICAYFKLNAEIQPDKMYPKDWMNPGRVKVELIKEDGKLANPAVKNKKDLMLKLGELIPKLKSRASGAGSKGATTQGTTETAGDGKKKKNKKRG